MKYYTVAQAAEILQCKPVTVRRAIESGLLPAHQPVHKIIISSKHLEDFINSKPVVPRMDARLLTRVHPAVSNLLKGGKAA